MPQLQREYPGRRFSTAALQGAFQLCSHPTPFDEIAGGTYSITRDTETWTYNSSDDFFRDYDGSCDGFGYRPQLTGGNQLDIWGGPEKVWVRVTRKSRDEVLRVFDLLEADNTGHAQSTILAEGRYRPQGVGTHPSEIPRGGTADVPASDRIVPLNHNAPEYKSLIEALGDLHDKVRTTNQFPDNEDREVRIAEISAGLTLLSRRHIRLGVATVMLGGVLRFCIHQFPGNEISAVAEAALKLLNQILGIG